VLKVLDQAAVPAGPIYTAADIVADEQYQARDMIQRLPVRGEPEPVGFPGIVPVVGGRSLPVRSVGPDLGADTRDVLTKILGRTSNEVDHMLEEAG
jgi:formyl-CoA transferase